MDYYEFSDFSMKFPPPPEVVQRAPIEAATGGVL